MSDEDQAIQNRGPRWGLRHHPQDSLCCSIKNLPTADRRRFCPSVTHVTWRRLLQCTLAPTTSPCQHENAFREQSIAKEAIRDYIEPLRKKEGSDVTSCSSLPAFAGLERLFGNSDGGGASLHRQLMPRVLELFTGHFEHHDGLLNHILHQDILAVGREGHPL